MHAKPTEENAGGEKSKCSLLGMCTELRGAVYHRRPSAVNAAGALHSCPVCLIAYGSHIDLCFPLISFDRSRNCTEKINNGLKELILHVLLFGFIE